MLGFLELLCDMKTNDVTSKTHIVYSEDNMEDAEHLINGMEIVEEIWKDKETYIITDQGIQMHNNGIALVMPLLSSTGTIFPVPPNKI